ncbi:MAG: PAS domain-containing protein [Deltaproteobacteria bacterium]|nr:PAS domain-containing protein [Deltaproteobacteria bacterium]
MQLLVVGVLWILVTDILLYGLTEDPVLIARLETAKGWVFVGCAAIAMFALVARAMHGLAYSQAMNAAVLDSIGEGVLVIGRDRSVHAANPAAVRMLGAANAHELVGMTPQDFARRFRVTTADEGTVVRWEDFVSQRALSGERPPPYKARLHVPGGSIVILSTGAPVRACPDGRVEAAVSIMLDITELERVEQIRDQFFASAAHAIKTPVSILRAQVELAATEPLSGRSRLIIERQCGRLDRLTDNILALLRIHDHALRLHPTRVEVDGLVGHVSREMAHASADHLLQARVRGRPIVFADPERLTLLVRDMIELAYRRARTSTIVNLEAREVADRVELSVGYEYVAPREAADEEDGAGYTRLGLETAVIDALAAASSGVLRTRTESSRRIDWLELPALDEEVHHGFA